MHSTPRHSSRSPWPIVLVIAAALLLAACGSGSSTQAEPANQPAAEQVAADGHGDHHHDHAAGGDRGLGMLHNGHHEEMTYTPLSADEQTQLDALLATSREVAKRYPTLGDAIDGGFRRAGPFAPGLGIHYNAPWIGEGLNPDGVVADDDAAHPMTVIFDGTGRDAKVAGFMYYSLATDQPTGFPGTNDTWHYHTNTCIVGTDDGINAPLGADRDVDPAQCQALGGSTMAKTQWMVHVWSVPGYEVAEADGGVFAEVNPKITCADGSYFMMDLEQMPQHPRNVCKSELAS